MRQRVDTAQPIRIANAVERFGGSAQQVGPGETVPRREYVERRRGGRSRLPVLKCIFITHDRIERCCLQDVEIAAPQRQASQLDIGGIGSFRAVRSAPGLQEFPQYRRGYLFWYRSVVAAPPPGRGDRVDRRGLRVRIDDVRHAFPQSERQQPVRRAETGDLGHPPPDRQRQRQFELRGGAQQLAFRRRQRGNELAHRQRFQRFPQLLLPRQHPVGKMPLHRGDSGFGGLFVGQHRAKQQVAQSGIAARCRDGALRQRVVTPPHRSVAAGPPPAAAASPACARRSPASPAAARPAGVPRGRAPDTRRGSDSGR